MRLASSRALTIRYVIVLLILAILSGIAYLALRTVIVSGRELSGFIRLSDQQQLSSQLIAYYSLALAQAKTPQERAEFRAKLNQEIDALAREEDLLVSGADGLD